MSPFTLLEVSGAPLHFLRSRSPVACTALSLKHWSAIRCISYRGNLFEKNCLLHSFDCRRDVSACGRYAVRHS